jgi:hypothetical protein
MKNKNLFFVNFLLTMCRSFGILVHAVGKSVESEGNRLERYGGVA